MLSNCVHFHHFSKLVFCYSVYNVPASFSGSYKAFVLQKPSYICESAGDSDSRSVMALRSPSVLPATGLRKFRLYSKGLYCAPDLTTEEPNNKILLYATVVEGSLVTLAVLYFCTTILCFVKKKRRVNNLLSEQQQRGAGIEKVNRQQGGFARLTFVIVVLFCICYVPFLIIIYKG